MRLVSGARYASLRTSYQRAIEARDDAEKLAAERLATITRQATRITDLLDATPDAPVQQPRPVLGDVELRRQLHLARRALTELAAQVDALQDSHIADTRELHDLRQGGSK